MTVAIVCFCPACDYLVATAVQPNAIGTHGCAQCGGLMQVYIAQGSKEVVQWHDRPPTQRDPAEPRDIEAPSRSGSSRSEQSHVDP